MLTRTPNASLLPYNTFGIAATARELVTFASATDLEALAPWPAQKPLPLVIGRGSNLLFVSPVVDRTVLVATDTSIEVTGRDPATGSMLLRVGAGREWDSLVAESLDMGLAGLENLSGIPGTAGASAVQNIGAYGAEAKDFIASVETVDLLTGQGRIFTPEECGYGYRRSVFKDPAFKRYVVSHVSYRLCSGGEHYRPNLAYRGLAEALAGEAAPTPHDVRRAVLALRNSKLPSPEVMGNAGSFFTNPVVGLYVAGRLQATYADMPAWPVEGEPGRRKLSAAWLIDHAGWKGRSMGRAGVYDKQPLVLVNLGGATGSDIARLSEAIVADVEAKFGVTLVAEVNFI